MLIDKTLEVPGINQRSEEILKEFLSHYSGDGTFVNGIRRLCEVTKKTVLQNYYMMIMFFQETICLKV